MASIPARWIPVAALLAQQCGLVLVLGSAMQLLHRLTGRTLRGLADTPTGGDLVVYACVTGALCWASLRFAERVRGDARGAAWRGAPAVFVGGFVLGAACNAAPWLLAIGQGDARVVSWRPPEMSSAAVFLGVVLAWWNAAFEEITSRAVPHRLLAHWGPASSAAVVAAAFALMHGIGESLNPSRLVYLWSLGVVLSTCWIATQRIALGTGLHAGWFWASFIPSGRFESGAVLALDGRVGPYVLWTDRLLTVVALSALVWLHRRPRARHLPES
ncbi:MAG: CPBP family glutamic-type intramembrane protease [Gemmatimonadaceae bacterium]|nr:CPBP family glutamic-type intramembrane protease [Gemmatimonadaceae bacterium]